MARLPGRGAAGINTVVWNMRAAADGRARRRCAGGGGAPASANPIDQWAPLGDYTVTLRGRRQDAHPDKCAIAKTQGWSLGTTPQIIR